MLTEMLFTSSIITGFFLLSLFLATGELSVSYNAGPSHFPDLPPKSSHYAKIVPEDDKNIDVYATIIDMLGKLNVLTPQTKTCYVLQKIVREVKASNPNLQKRIIGVHLYFTESVMSNETDKNRDPLSKHSTSIGNSKTNTTVHLECKNNHVVTLLDSDSYHISNNSLNMGLNSSGNSSGGISAPSTKVEDSTTDEDIIAPSSKAKNEWRSNGSRSKQKKFEYAHSVHIHLKQGLSHTQVVVIATCSAVIGAFFLVAGIMRIRNYVKRVREEQAIAKRPTFRSCSMALRNSTGSSELLRREISNNPTMKGGEETPFEHNSGGDNSIHSSRKNSQADKQTLVVTNASSPITPNLPSPTSSIQFIDEEPIKKDLLQTDSEDEGESESCPLLAAELLNGKEYSTDHKMGVVRFGNTIALENSPNTGEFNNINEEINLLEIPEEEENVEPTNPSSPVDISQFEQGVEETAAVGSINIGLTQSDSSLSSNNKYYCYGNQAEYAGVCECCDFTPNSGSNSLQTPSEIPLLTNHVVMDSLENNFSGPLPDASDIAIVSSRDGRRDGESICTEKSLDSCNGLSDSENSTKEFNEMEELQWKDADERTALVSQMELLPQGGC